MKRILCISNMYPSQKYPHYGIFVKNTTEIIKKNNRVTECYMKKTDNYLFKVLNYFFFYLKTIVYLFFLKFDYIYIHYPSLSGFPLLFVRKFKKINSKIIVNIHGNDLIPETKDDCKYVPITLKLMEMANIIVVPSDYFKEEVIKRKNNLKKKLIVIPSGGIDLNVFKKIEKGFARKHFNLEDSLIYIGFASRIEKNKGWDIFLEAFLKLSITDSNLRAILVGSGSELNLMNKYIYEKKIEKKVILLPFLNHDDLNIFFNAVDIFVFPTRRKSESLGLVGLEAMAAGCIVVSSNIYGPSSYAVDNFNSVTFNPNNSSELAMCLEKVFSKKNEALYLVLKENAKKTAKLYDINATRELIDRLFI